MADPPADLEIRPLRPGDDPDAQLDLSERAFGPGFGTDRDRRLRSLSRLVAGGRYLGAFVGGRPAAAAAIQDMRQWWRGRPVPMAGVSSVTVAPEYRGLGIGRLLMTALLDEIAARRYPLSALFPATMPLYRSLGWELAGARNTAVIPARSLLRLVPPDALPPDALPPDALPPAPPAPPRLHRAGPGDAEAVTAVLGRVHEAARDCGPITWDAASAAEWLADPGLYAYLAEDGVLAYRWHHRDLFAERAEAISARTVRAFWAQLGSHASIAENVQARTGPASAFWWLTQERDAQIARRSRWMLRVVDAAAAIAARGFPAGVSVRVPVRIADGARPANSGRALRRDAAGHAAPGGPGRGRDGGGRRGPGRRLRRHALHARRLLTDTPLALRAAPPAGR